jgi:predicted O-linked N-acetylglucosamine transferase (SPINDLY family)
MNELLEARLDPIRNPDREVGMTAFNLAYHGRNNAELLRLQGRVSRSLYPARAECARKLVRGRRLRIGFVSTFFHHHSVGRTTIGLIRDLPRADFDVYVFAVAPRPNDDWADAIRGAADHYVSLPAALEQVRETIDAAQLDVLLFADIGMHPLTYFLALWRLAPIQLVTWGHSVTSGIDTIDYYVSSDAIEAPGSEDQYTEKLLRLPGYFMPRYRRPALEGPRKTRRQLGLPEDAHIYYCPQNLFKLHPDFDATLKAILELDPRAGILLMESRKSWATLIRKRFARTLGAAASRVHFVGRMPQPDFLQYIAAADVILDPFYFGGCNSSCEALALGVPVVTLPAFQLPGRFTLGLYKEIGVEDCIAGSPEQYAEIAVRLARQPDYRRSVSERISARCGQLFDRPDTGVALGEALLRIAETAR